MDFQRYGYSNAGWMQMSDDTRPDSNPSVTWTEVRNLSANDVRPLASTLSMDAELLEYSIETNASFIAADSDALLQLATRTARLVDSQIQYGSLVIVVTPDGLTTLESADSGIGAAVRASSHRNTIKVGPWSLLAMLLDVFADSYLPLVESVEDQVLAIEEHLFDAPLPSHQIAMLFRMRRQLILLQRVLGPVSKLVARLALNSKPSADSESPNFRAAHDGLQRLERTVDSLWQVITSVVEMNNLIEQQRQGSTSRKLAAWAGIIAVPTAMSGVFGMNFHRMPGFDTEYGYLAALAVMALASGTLFVRFRKLGWL